MNDGMPGRREVAREFARQIGRVRGREPGPLLLVVGGIHGNEPAGVLAARRVVERLVREGPELRGDFVALAGNVRALRRGVRFIDYDLNRAWTPARLAALDEATATGPRLVPSEDLESRELSEAIEAERAGARGPIYCLDLHTTSADGIPFAMARDESPSRDFALHFPLPIILGLLNQVDGALLEHMRRSGCVVMGIEAGQHARDSSVLHHEAALWIALVAAGLLRRETVPDLERFRAVLEGARRELPHVMQVQHRHAIRPEDDFQMQPGFANIQPIRAGELLAHDRNGEIRAERDGLLFLPLYQALGEEGFFLGRSVPAVTGRSRR